MDERQRASWDAWTALRDQREQEGWKDRKLAEREHEAFMRMWVNDDPWRAVPAGLFAPAGYALLKASGLKQADTPASFGQIISGMSGYGRGLMDLLGG